MCCRGSGCCSLAVVIIWKAAQQLARLHEGRREEGTPGKLRTFYNYMICMEVREKLWKLNLKMSRSPEL